MLNADTLNTAPLNESSLGSDTQAQVAIRDYINNLVTRIRNEVVLADEIQLSVGAEVQVIQPGTRVRATIVDSLDAPTQTEIIDIYSVESDGLGYIIKVDRALEGTLAHEWQKDAFIEARPTAGLMREKVHKEPGKGLSTNDFTDAEKYKLGSVYPGATKNATDVQLRDRSTHTGEQPIATVSGLQEALDGKARNNDARLSDAREWIATTVSELEAKAGSNTTRRAWTSQRVRQAALSAINTVDNATQALRGWLSPEDKTKLDGVAAGATANAADAHLLDRANHTGTQAISTIAELQTTLNGKATSAQGAKADSALQPTGSTADDLTVTALTEPTGVAASEAIDRSDGRYQQYTMTAATTFSVALAEGQVLDLYVSGGDLNTPTWPTMVWIGGAPTLAANSVIRFTKVGGTLYGEHVGDY